VQCQAKMVFFTGWRLQSYNNNGLAYPHLD
jgi:hypothetical protein